MLVLVLDLVLDLVLRCTIWRHFAVLTINLAVRLNRDHLFLAREGWPKAKSWKFKVVTLGTGF